MPDPNPIAAQRHRRHPMKKLPLLITLATAAALTACAPEPGVVGGSAVMPVTGERESAQVPCGMVPGRGDVGLCDQPLGGGAVFTP